MPYRKKLIEVSLPLEAINAESAREKSIRHGHPSTLHLWWARRPLAACRAVLWSSLVDDPSEYMPDEESANRERDRLFGILERLVKWENINNEEVLDLAKLEIARSVARDLKCVVPVGKQAINDFLATKAPPVLDPFAGGGSIPLEAQRLGLRAYASDLNPVAVLINKALIEIPPKFADIPPVHPSEEEQGRLLKQEWKGAKGLAEDVRYYGKLLRDEAEKSIGDLYPKVRISHELLDEREDLIKQGLKVGDELTVIAWIWARTVKCPNPACGVQMPLANSFVLSNKKGNEAYVLPIVDEKQIRYVVRHGSNAPMPPKIARGANFRCVRCGEASSEDYIRSEANGHRLSEVLIAVVVEGRNGRIYLSPDKIQITAAVVPLPENYPTGNITYNPRDFRPPYYGLTTYGELFTPRQLTTLTTLQGLLNKIKNRIDEDVKKTSLTPEDIGSYGNAIIIYLSFIIDKLVDYHSSLCTWHYSKELIRNTFGRQAVGITWDYSEANPFSGSAGSIDNMIDWISKCLVYLPESCIRGEVSQRDAQSDNGMRNILVSTDPPYYNNIAYADLSDYFYVWIRKSLRSYYPDLFQTMLVPKSEELVANPYRFEKGMEEARHFFEDGMLKTFRQIYSYSSSDVPITVYYAYKQSESDEEDKTASTGWETILSAINRANLAITGTWPMRTEMANRTIGIEANALASSIVLVCRKRAEDASVCTRREFLMALQHELPSSLRKLQLVNIAPVDLAQAAIGPGMAVFSRHKAVLEADGSVMHVRSALALINQALDAYLAEQEGNFDSDTRWALAWFEQYGHEQGPYGVAETLSKAKNTSVEGLAQAGFLEARAGKVRLLRRSELDDSWDPSKDKRLTAWEACQYLIRLLDSDGEKGSGALLGKLGAIGETARDLAYRLFTICERKGWAQEALAYNMLVVAWPRIKEQSGKGPRQESML